MLVMRFYNKRLTTATVALTLALITGHLSYVRSQSSAGNVVGKGIGGLVGAATGAVAGGIAGANSGSEAGANASNAVSNSVSNAAQGSGSSSSGSAGSSTGSSSSSSSASLSTSGSSSQSSAESSSSGGSSQAQSNASVSTGTTSKPEGLMTKMRDMFKESKEMIKEKVDNLVKDEKRSEASASSQSSSSPGGSQSSGQASISSQGGQSSSSSGSSASLSGSISGSGASASASASASVSQSTSKPEGLLEKMGDKVSEIAKKSKEVIKDVIEPKKDEVKAESKAETKSDSKSEMKAESRSEVKSSDSKGNETKAKVSVKKEGDGLGKKIERKLEDIKDRLKEKKEEIKSEFLGDRKEEVKSEASVRSGDSLVKAQSQSQTQIQTQAKKDEGPIDKITKLVGKGTETAKDAVHKIGEKAHEVGTKVLNIVDDTIRKPMQNATGSGVQGNEGKLSAQSEATVTMKGEQKEKQLVELKKKQESEMPRTQSLSQIVAEAKSKGVIPQNEDRSALKGNHVDEKSVALEVFDKAHEISKIPVEKVLRPIDHMLGYEKDPLIRVYDNSHEILRKPLSIVSKPVESIFNGAFKTSDESKRESDRYLSTLSETERREIKMREERRRKEDRSVTGDIVDKTIELATKPIEIVLRPVDHFLGLDKEGKKNPILRKFEELYGLSKKPVDAFAKPLENILRKMGDDGQLYQVSVRFQNERDNNDPKLITRLADGALNIADRIITKPLEIVMKPLDHALGYDEPGKRNPIVEAAHSLKNATKIGVELFTRPIDRIIKEIADISDQKNDQAREQRQREETSRIVKALDKLHETVQYPFEIVLRPVSKALGTYKEGKKESFFRAWDVVHQVIRAPIQVISKPLEDAVLGEQKKQRTEVKVSANAGGQSKSGSISASASASVGSSGGGGNGSSNNSASAKLSAQPERKKNIIVDFIKKVEKLYAKPIEVVTSPVRKMILGEDNEKLGTSTDKTNREIQAKARAGNQTAAEAKAIAAKRGPDKIVNTIEKMNNIALKPLQVITQPISDILSHEKQQLQKQLNQQQQQAKGQVQVQAKTGQIQAQVQSKVQSSQNS